jgi:hypothetical protein
MQAMMNAKSGQEDDVGDSGTMSKGGKSGITESYDTDTFEDQSISQSHGSSKKEQKGIQYWPGKDAMDNSYSMSQSEQKTDDKPHNANAMEEYLKKQAEKKGTGAKPVAKRAAKDISESSDKYTDEDFESISKSQSLPPATTDANRQTPGFGNSRITNNYVRKESKVTMTDKGKYDAQSEAPSGGANWALKRNLEDAEGMI